MRQNLTKALRVPFQIIFNLLLLIHNNIYICNIKNFDSNFKNVCKTLINMKILNNASAEWNGTLKKGKGQICFNEYKFPFNFSSRFEKGKLINPEELIGASYASCYSMFLSALLTENSLNPSLINTEVSVLLEEDEIGPLITKIEINLKVKCEGLTEDKLKDLAIIAKEKCPISRTINKKISILNSVKLIS